MFALCAAAVALSSCNPAKRLAKDEYLLKKNEIKLKDDIQADKEALLETVRQQPNRKILGVFPLYVWAYNIPNPDKFEARNEKRIEKLKRKNEKRLEKGKDALVFKPAGTWWRETVGEPPVVFDSAATKRSEEQLKTYLIKHGWFNAEVKSRVDTLKGQQAINVTYIVEGGTPYIIDTLMYDIPDARLERYTKEARTQTGNVRQGAQFDIDELDKERERLTEYFRNRGYYDFNKELIYFDVDSNLNHHAVELTLGIIPRKVPYSGDPDSLITAPYKRYTIESITLIDRPYKRTTNIFDTDTIFVDPYRIIDQNQLQVKPKLLVGNVLFKPGDYYDISKVTRTYRRLSSLPIVRATGIQFSPVKESLDNDRLNATISLIPAPKQNVSVAWNGTNRGGFLGIAGTLTYLNRNIFGGAEVLNINISGGVEAQQLLTESAGASNTLDNDLQNNLYLNTLEFGPEVSLIVPKFLLPIKTDRFAKSADPTTVFTANLSYQRRPDYERTRSFGSISYRWSESDQKKWSISPLEVSLIKIFRSEAFDRQLEEIGDPFLINSFQDHFIVDSRVGYTYNTQRQGAKDKNLYFYHGEFESAGSLLRSLYSLSDAEKNENGSYEILDIPFAHYLKTIHDFRYYRNHNEKMSTAYRFSGGIGVPLRNLDVLPFEKSFFGGGANDIRAWQARTLGPGSFRDPERNFDKIGDILLEANVEYRFALVDVLEGAFFVDAGNIWTINPESARPGADFEFDRFLGEIAIGAGTGLRLNFDFFLIRLDLGLQIKDPALDRGERWLFQPKKEYNEYIRNLNESRPDSDQLAPYSWRWNLNIGIGYPF